MKNELRVIGIAFAVFVGIGTTLSFAQQKQPAKERQPGTDEIRFEVEREMQGQQLPPSPGAPGDFVFLSTEMTAGGRVVKGAPYSAQAITESTQTLSDGNRIVNKSTTAIYRDSEGRTRREMSLTAIASFSTGGEAPQAILINDPVAGTTYMLDPRTHVARKMPPMRFNFKVRVPAPGGEKLSGSPEPPPPDLPQRAEVAPFAAAEASTPDGHFVWGFGNHVAINESLGKQNVEGVEAQGTRGRMTIPAGEIGNERPIEIVHEMWYSPELQTLVMTRHSDPRFGESSYRLTNIDRSEPARSLFEVPADYTLKSGAAGPEDNNASATYRSTGVISGGVLNGKATRLPLPAYPPIAKAAGASGSVKVDVTIDEDGNVVAAKAVSGHPLLQAAAVAAARNAKFSPTKLSGQAVKVQGVLVYTFAAEPLVQTQTNN